MIGQKIPVQFKGHTLAVKAGSNLREALLKQGLSPYNGAAHFLNCRGMGTCGTCAVRVKGKVNPPTKVEKWRLNFPPHKAESGLRLACQCTVTNALQLEKGNGFWGQIPLVTSPEAD